MKFIFTPRLKSLRSICKRVEAKLLTGLESRVEFIWRETMAKVQGPCLVWLLSFLELRHFCFRNISKIPVSNAVKVRKYRLALDVILRHILLVKCYFSLHSSSQNFDISLRREKNKVLTRSESRVEFIYEEKQWQKESIWFVVQHKGVLLS